MIACNSKKRPARGHRTSAPGTYLNTTSARVPGSPRLGVPAQQGEARAEFGRPGRGEFGEDRRDSARVGRRQLRRDARRPASGGVSRLVADLAVEAFGGQIPDVPDDARRPCRRQTRAYAVNIRCAPWTSVTAT